MMATAAARAVERPVHHELGARPFPTSAVTRTIARGGRTTVLPTVQAAACLPTQRLTAPAITVPPAGADR